MTKQAYKAELLRRNEEGLFPSATKYGGCQYRGPEGRRCAVGVLIPDELYRENMEGCSIHPPTLCDGIMVTSSLLDELRANGVIPEGVTDEQLYKLQLAHDRRVNQGLPWSKEEFAREVEVILGD